MTEAQRTILARTSDGEWHQGCDLTRAPGVLGKLLALEYLRCDFDHLPIYERRFTITPDGLAVLEVTA